MRRKRRIQQQEQYNDTPEVTRNDSSLLFVDSKKKKLNPILNWSDGTWGL